MADHNRIVCRSSAKVNFTLDVVALRADGYHELRSVVHTVGPWDELTLSFGVGVGDELRLTCDRPELTGDDNLCLRAARAFSDATGSPRRESLHIDLRKNIPSGAGLGGGSGNAAAILLALNRRYGEPLHPAALLEIAAGLGADVPLFLKGGCSLIEGIGERVASLPLLSGWLVLAKPGDHIATAGIFRQWDEMKLRTAAATDALLDLLAAQTKAPTSADPPATIILPASTILPAVAVANALQNDLRQVVESRGIPVGELVERLKSHGAAGATMTGSGSAVYGLFPDRESAALAARQLRTSLPADHWIEDVPLCPHGVEFAW